MTFSKFVHLRAHTAYSLSEGALTVNEAIRLAAKNSMPALGIADTNNLFGALEFSINASKAGVQPIIGCSLGLLTDENVQIGFPSIEPDPLILIAQNETGYGNLMNLSSAAFLETEDNQSPHITWNHLSKFSDGIIALTGGLKGPIGRLLTKGKEEDASVVLSRLSQIFDKRIYVEIQRHGVEAEILIESKTIDLAYKYNIPLVATNDIFFGSVDMHEAHDVLMCIAAGTFQSEDDRRRVTIESRFKSELEMTDLFKDLPEAIDNTLVIAKRCSFCCKTRLPILPTFKDLGGESEENILLEKATKGLNMRLSIDSYTNESDYHSRLDHELKIITEMGFAGYFLVVADFISFAHQSKIPVGPGRGSGAGSVVAWSLRITDLDPIKFGLLFERFLNPHRISMPDFDIDFCQERRDEVIKYVQSRYGVDRVAQIITFGTLQARAAIRDVGRVLEVPYGFVDRIAKMVPYNPANPLTLSQAIDGEPRLQVEAENDERISKTLDIAKKIEGLFRHASTHAAGVVIGDRPLTELVPLYRDPRSEMPVTQYSMKYVESAGLVKFDFLGLKTLTVIDKALNLINRTKSLSLDINNISLNDEVTFKMLSKGETIGVFQLESGGMRDLLRDVQPSGIEDIIAIVALYRPGPMENIPKYVACKHEREKPEYLHELIEPIVADTYGVIIYQEQVMQIAQIFAGFSMAEADILRRAMGKKIKSEMDSLRDRFVQGAKKNGVSADKASHVFDLVDKFAGYGFNKAHSAGYALIAYQTAFLKAHYPVEFIAASMTVDMGNTDKLAIFAQEAKRLNILIHPPDINSSEIDFTVEKSNADLSIRYALSAVRNVGVQAMTSLVNERNSNGIFSSLSDFSSRVDPKGINRRQLENLARAGGFDSLHDNRAEVIANIEIILRHASSAAQEREDGQVSLFGKNTVIADSPFKLNKTKALKSAEILRHERESLGLYLSSHPMEAYKDILSNKKITPLFNVSEKITKGVSSLLLAGTVDRKQERRSARGNRFAYITISDTSDQIEVLVFSDKLIEYRDLLEPGTSLIITVDVRQDRDAVRYSASNIESLDSYALRQTSEVEIKVNNSSIIPDLKGILDQALGGNISVLISVNGQEKSREIQIKLPEKYAVTPAVKEEISKTPGVIGVFDRKSTT